MTKIIHRFKTATIVDREAFNALTNDRLAETTAELYGNKDAPPPQFMSNLNTFFSRQNLSKELLSQGPHLPILLEKWEIDVSDEEVKLIQDFNKLRNELSARIDAKKPDYPFATCPDVYDLLSTISIKPTCVRRLGRHDTGYSIGTKTLKRIFDHAAKAWAEGRTPDRIGSINASGYTRSVTFSKTTVEIGCQTIQRYEIEQIALHQGWEFP